jgi:urate oxidase
MGIVLAENSYGKSRVRLLRITRQEHRHDVRDVTLNIRFEGDFAAAHAAGDNRKILPTDTMKNTVYVLAQQYPSESIEDFALHLVEHFLTYNPQVSVVHVDAVECPWTRIQLGAKPHPSAFTLTGSEKRTANLRATRDEATVRAGLQDLLILKTTGSAFEKFLRDPYTTLPDAPDRILSTAVTASWLYSAGEIAFSPAWHNVRRTILESFAQHESKSLQHSLYAMGEAVLASFDEIQEIHFSLPNRHYLLMDLSRFGLENNNEVFLPSDEPHGLIEATLRRG